jgi:hypothetical protein
MSWASGQKPFTFSLSCASLCCFWWPLALSPLLRVRGPSTSLWLWFQDICVCLCSQFILCSFVTVAVADCEFSNPPGRPFGGWCPPTRRWFLLWMCVSERWTQTKLAYGMSTSQFQPVVWFKYEYVFCFIYVKSTVFSSMNLRVQFLVHLFYLTCMRSGRVACFISLDIW